MTEFTTWRSLVDGAEIGVIPDSVDYHWDFFDDADSLEDTESGVTITLDGATLSGSEPEDGFLRTEPDTDGAFAPNESDFTSEPFTYNMLVYPRDLDTGTANKNIIGVNDGTTSPGDLNWTITEDSSDEFEFPVNITDSRGGAIASITLDEWQVWTVILDEDERAYIYVNGELVDDGQIDFDREFFNGDLEIGNVSGSAAGDIDFNVLEIAPDTVWSDSKISDRADELLSRFE